MTTTRLNHANGDKSADNNGTERTLLFCYTGVLTSISCNKFFGNSIVQRIFVTCYQVVLISTL